MHEPPDLAVDFMDMTDDRHLLTRVVDARLGYRPEVGGHALVGDDDADPKVARILSIDVDGIIELEVLPGSADAHRGLLGHGSGFPVVSIGRQITSDDVAAALGDE